MNYKDLVNIDEFKKREDFSLERWDISFYCKDCEKLVEAIRKNPNWYKFICPLCNWWNISIWTFEGIKENYKNKIQ